MWIAQNEQTGRSLAGPGVGMKWDYIEVNPFYKSGSNLKSKLHRVSQTFSKIHINNKITIFKGSSTNIPLKDKEIDLVITDPPYFDSIDYTGLSEFFRPWFEVLIKNTFDKNVDLVNDTDNEAIVQLAKNNDKKVRGIEHYKGLMRDVFKESKRVLKDKGKLLFLYSHKTVEGWKVIAEAIKECGLFVEDCIPLEMERIARPRAMSYDALNGIITFKCVKDRINIQSIESDLIAFTKSLNDNDFNISHTPIYLASLACKLYTLTENDFDYCYKYIHTEFDKITIGNYDTLDGLVKSYILGYKNDLEILDNNQKELLERNKLIVDNKIKGISAINVDDLIYESDVFKKMVELFNNQIFNSSTTISLSKIESDNAYKLFGEISGNVLNTLKDRSFTVEKKTAKLILSKIK